MTDENSQVEIVGDNDRNFPDRDESIGQTKNEFWVFGYGSLVWKVDFPIECSRSGYIKGYLRRFYQNSIDHRGTIDKVTKHFIHDSMNVLVPIHFVLLQPGRVVTLIPSTDTESKVFGMAYKIPDNKIDEVLKHLDFREKNGYERHYVQFFPFDEHDDSGQLPTKPIVIYVATHDNESFAGSTGGLAAIVNQINGAIGPSGTNREYVYRLADAMRHHFPDQNDEHLFEIENLLREREKGSVF